MTSAAYVANSCLLSLSSCGSTVTFYLTLASKTYFGTLSAGMTVDCMICGGPATAALLPGFGDVEDSKPLPRQIRIVRAEGRLGDEDADGPLGP